MILAGWKPLVLRELKQLLVLAAPLVLAQLAQIATSFVDTLMVGRLGTEALAGIAVGSVIFMFVSIVLSGVILGVSAVVSQATGQGDQAVCGRAVRQGILLALVLWGPAMILFWNMEAVLLFFQQPETTAASSSAYLRAISWGLLPSLCAFSLRGLLEGKGDTGPIMVVMVGGVLLNIFANDTLMFGRYGFPEMGLVGTGFASSIVLTFHFVLLATYCSWKYPELRLLSRHAFVDSTMIRELLRIGAPIGVSLGFEASMFTAAAIAMGTLGEDPLAAHQIVMQAASVSFMVPLGVAIATSVRVGHNIGAGRPQVARLAGYLGMLTAGSVMICSAILFLVGPELVIGCFIEPGLQENIEVNRFATRFLAIAGLFQVFDGIQVAANLSLRGLKDTFAAMVLTMVSYWGVGCLVGGFLAFGLDWGGDGIWMGMTAGLATAALLLVLRFRYRIRQDIRANQDGATESP